MAEEKFDAADIEALVQMLKEASLNEADNKDNSFLQLQNSAHNFVQGYYQLDNLYQNNRLRDLQNVIRSNDETGLVILNNFKKIRNEETLFVRSKYLLAFNFDNALTKFRGEVPKSAVYVLIDTQGVPHSYNMPLQELVLLLNKEGRIGNPTMSGFIRKEYQTLEEQKLKEDAEESLHIQTVQAAYSGTSARLGRYYEKFGLSGSAAQGGRLLWKTGREWTIARVNNGGDLKEAYVAALMVKHKSDLDRLCGIGIGGGPYYSHALIETFFNNYIYGVTNMAAIREEDVVTDSAQYAVKGSKAAAPVFNQYLETAEHIINSNDLTKEALEEWIATRWPDDIHRNQIESVLENCSDKDIDQILDELVKGLT